MEEGFRPEDFKNASPIALKARHRYGICICRPPGIAHPQVRFGHARRECQTQERPSNTSAVPACLPMLFLVCRHGVTLAEKGSSPQAVTAIPTHLRKICRAEYSINLHRTTTSSNVFPCHSDNLHVLQAVTGVLWTRTSSASFDSGSYSSSEQNSFGRSNFLWVRQVKDKHRSIQPSHPSLSEPGPVPFKRATPNDKQEEEFWEKSGYAFLSTLT